MAKTLGEAFKTFCAKSVDLEPDETAKARLSSDFLLDQLHKIAKNNPDIPKINNHIFFGSFARRTKIRPLDDIDLMVVLDKEDLNLEFLIISLLIKQINPKLKVINKNSPLKSLEDENGHINSIKVVNKFVSLLSKIPNYKKAEINRNKQAAVLNLSSYSWRFDIVPAFEIPDIWNKNVSYYIIPDGKGKWMKTDPRIDSESIIKLNQKHGKMFLPVLRLLKHWNNFDFNKPKLESYYFETLVAKVFGNRAPQIKSFPLAIRDFFKNCPSHLMNPCPDPKGLGPELDSKLESGMKQKIRDEMRDALLLCEKAISYEERQRHRDAILHWHIILGPEFPTYG